MYIFTCICKTFMHATCLSLTCRQVNLIDNMINLLEKYASNLEGIVAQRTAELADEKDRADQLLYRMLPK